MPETQNLVVTIMAVSWHKKTNNKVLTTII